MKKGRSSRTAEYMALFRALESALPADRRLFNDPFAKLFLSPPLRRVAGLASIPWLGAWLRMYIDYQWPGARTSAAARTPFIDDMLLTAIASGIEQVVILGAGFDARAYRLSRTTWTTVFEVDHPATSTVKKGAVEAKLGSIPRHVRFVTLEFNAEPLQSTMRSAGYDASRRTLFIWEGVTNYLTEAAVDKVLRWCADAAAGSKVIFTYIHRHVLVAPHMFEGTKKLFATLRVAGEQWTFGIDPSLLFSFLGDRGLRLEQDLGADEYRARYYGHAANEMRGYEFYRIAVARIS